MFGRFPTRKLAVSLIAFVGFSATHSAEASVQQAEVPSIGLQFTELPTTIKEIRYVFECADGLKVETKWIAENVGDVAPRNYQIATLELVTKKPLNVAQLTRPKNGWPVGLYRLELWHNGKKFHTVRYVLEDPQHLEHTKSDVSARVQ